MSGRSWQDNPVVMLGGAFAAGAAAALTVAIPVYTTSLKNDYDERVKVVERQYIDDKAGVGLVQSVRKENAFLKSTVSKLLVELYAVSEKKPFLPGNPIPVGLDVVKVGAPADEIIYAFPAANISQSGGGYYYVDIDGGLFRKLQIDADDGKILDITYYARDGARLLAAATVAFGPPHSQEEGRRGEIHYSWTVAGKRVIINGDQYSIF